MNNFSKKKNFVGVDISKDKLDLALLKQTTPNEFKDKIVKNDLKDFDSIIPWIVKQGIELKNCAFCMEHTGTYGLLFLAWLSKSKIDYCVENALKIKRSLGLIRGKNDKVDARRIADYAFSHKSKLKPYTLPSNLMIQIKQLLTYRDQMVKIRTSLKNSLKSHKQYQLAGGLCTIAMDIEIQIDDFRKRISMLEKQLKDLIQSEESISKNFKLATSVKGIALVIAAYMLVTTNNFTCFENGRKYACYSGIAPFEYSSGSSIKGKTKVSHLANKKMKSILANGANAASQWDPELKKYYERKIAEGKEHKLVINSISCKLVNRVFAVIKRQSPYVNIYEQNFNKKNLTLA